MMIASFKDLTSADIPSVLQSILSNPRILLTYYQENDALAIATLVSGAVTVIHYLSAEIFRDYSQVDRAWSILPILYAWHFTIHDYLTKEVFNPRLVVASILISIWGSRLTFNFARKGGYYRNSQDYRYLYIKEKIGGVLMAILNLTAIAPFQNILLLLISSPLYVVSKVSNKSVALSTFDWIIVSLHLGFLLIEAVADEQQYAFQTAKHALLEYLQSSQLKDDYKHGFLWHSGLFQYSRHPNFFAEMSMWWVIYLFSVSAIQEATGVLHVGSFFNWTIIGPILLTLLFQGSTSLTERISAGKYTDYKIYQKCVNKFIPWFPSNEQHLKQD
ncbi:hypothetical protein G6F70_007122 [Rhizopus microsporus]|nr:hypothetical protein G6F71_007189 [Rhizopus microsporus]KAG1196843.1 hypothetical protein G6F70_007122 [Rhizopus microsporus]KAG1213826.1 hypothetical protein G6F69_002495 [Rhizopus microsporus]